MKPVGPLMIEHRLIERLIRLLRTKADAFEATGRPDAGFLESALDFIRTYADRCHHGKEEDILFRDLGRKRLSSEHGRILKELLEEHVRARAVTRALAEATDRSVRGDAGAVRDIVSLMRQLAELYPAHIAKEDKSFFMPVMEYFDAKEQARMLEEFREFDRLLVHERYRAIIESLER